MPAAMEIFGEVKPSRRLYVCIYRFNSALKAPPRVSSKVNRALDLDDGQAARDRRGEISTASAEIETGLTRPVSVKGRELNDTSHQV